jgi:membrane protease YdiL (CAAX protease family)
MSLIMTWIDVLQPAEPILSILAFITGIISITTLFLSGMDRSSLYLRLGMISTRGFLVLVATTVLLLPILGSSTGFGGWKWLPGLVFAPASGIAQELYFRGSLLPALERALKGRRMIVLLFHAIVFVGYHYRTSRSVPSLPVALLVAVVLFLAGCGWAWQVQRDNTILWTTAQHSLFLMIMSMFEWG